MGKKFFYAIRQSPHFAFTVFLGISARKKSLGTSQHLYGLKVCACVSLSVCVCPFQLSNPTFFILKYLISISGDWVVNLEPSQYGLKHLKQSSCCFDE